MGLRWSYDIATFSGVPLLFLSRLLSWVANHPVVHGFQI